MAIDAERIVTGTATREDEAVDRAIRPRTLDDYVGQTAVKTQLEIFVSAARQRAEVQAVRHALAIAHGNLSRAAELLGVTRPTVYDLLERHHIDAAQFARDGNGGSEPATAP